MFIIQHSLTQCRIKSERYILEVLPHPGPQTFLAGGGAIGWRLPRGETRNEKITVSWLQLSAQHYSLTTIIGTGSPGHRVSTCPGSPGPG